MKVTIHIKDRNLLFARAKLVRQEEVYEQGYNDAVEELKKLKKTTMENKYKLWVARDWSGMLYAYFNKPIRDTVWKEWDSDKVSLSIDDSFFPELKWEDEPIEVELRPAITNLNTKANEYANSVTDRRYHLHRQPTIRQPAGETCDGCNKESD